MLSFASTADPESYLDWELAVEQKFNSHVVPAEHRVRLATSEFTSFALFWWTDLCNAGNAAAVPQTWPVFVMGSYAKRAGRTGIFGSGSSDLNPVAQGGSVLDLI